MIEIKNLNKYFNKGKKNEIHVINDTSLTLPDNGLVALLGESGCGKTTMLNAIGGLDTVKSGNIFINGEKITRRSNHAVDRIRNMSVGYIFQDYKLIEDMTVFDNVAIALKMVGIKDKQEIKVRVEYVLEKTGILRYRYRPASTLSGGERQRVGIARALVKNPDIILADEPTGNLDSKNSVEIMNIIKTISKDRLVILVTHERKLAEFYASRVVELVDGKVVKDYENEHNDNLDYDIDNMIYLKEFPAHRSFKEAGHEVEVYGNDDDKVSVNIIIKNGNIYIQSKDAVNIEVVDDSSGIDIVDDYKQEIDKETVDKYQFDMASVGNQSLKKRYSSIYNIFSAMFVGFIKVMHFSVLKRLLLLGFVFTGIFVVVAIGRIGSVIHVEDKDFVTSNKNYVAIEKRNMKVDEYLELEQKEGVRYMLPTEGGISYRFPLGGYYQTQDVELRLRGSLSDIGLITESDLVYGRMPKDKSEVVIDKITLDHILYEEEEAKMCGILSASDVIGRSANLLNKLSYTIVGVADCGSPSIYADKDELLKMLYSTYQYDNSNQSIYYSSGEENTGNELQITDYKLFESDITLEKGGVLPVNDYEVIINQSFKENYKLGSELSTAINGHKLKVVGYYAEPQGSTAYFTNADTIKYKQIEDAEIFVLCTDDKASLITELENDGFNVYDTFEKSKEEFDAARRDTVRSTSLIALVIVGISLIEMYLISRSSFLSRIKEVGTLRAIGAKKTDIYKMFLGEILAITTVTALPAMLVTYYLFRSLIAQVSAFSSVIYITLPMLGIGIAGIYLFNIIFGLLPVFNTMRKRPAVILARYDVD